MKRPVRLAALMAGMALFSAAGCGFQPLYAGGGGFDTLPGLAIQSGEDRFDYLVDAALRRHLGQGDSAHRLELTTRVRDRAIGISASGVARRYSLTAQTRYVLHPSGDRSPVRGMVSDTVQFDAPADPAAVIAARSDAEERAARQIAERLAFALAADLRRLPPPGSP
ncbi:hypothetical protein F1654_08580 [Alkalicaulis satelles]|uniref:LPS-assembly lipoprotein n=1 Tax=Alkalicaulis satelles TaxID=2609175 RepID=A0A5M6ZJC0_9PROT|nr:LPS assembly lipoprotein LptE [Alkalicaulis satelles]KAA5803844.1 hypothetical protein F1654_08580 [Alkalicaulis satelles]